jgi:ketosteroid isomerase-like protein
VSSTPAIGRLPARLTQRERFGVARVRSSRERADIEAVVALLAQDAVIAMPLLPTWYRGRDAVARFLARSLPPGESRWRLVPTSANGQVAFGQYVWNSKHNHFAAHGITVLAPRGEQIAELTAFLDPQAFASFGLPAVHGGLTPLGLSRP